MSAAFDDFARNLQAPDGAIAWAAKLPDGKVAGKTFQEQVAPQQPVQLLSKIRTTFPLLKEHGFEPVNGCWAFNHARIYFSCRTDGAAFLFWTENRPGSTVDESVVALLEKFVNLDMNGSL